MARDLATRQCLIPGCGARVPIREDRGGKLYYKCLGYADARQCGTTVIFKVGSQMDAALRRDIETDEVKEAHDESESTGRAPGAGEADPVPGNEPGAEGGAEPDTGAKGAGVGIDFLR